MSSSIPFLPPVGAVKFSPWEAFDRVWTSAVGYPAEEFKFIPGETPMATLREAVSMVVLYYAVIFGGQAWMKNRPAYKLNGLFMAHNFMLTVLSGTLLVLFAQQLIPSIWKHGLFDNICGASGWTKPLVTLYYLNYITKYVELLDTVFLFLKKKPLTFLHCYHHPATALLCYTQLVGHTPVSWVPITLNLSVHVVMYWYYFQSARGIRITWKEWITRLQIAQFVLDLIAIYFATYSYWASAYHPSLPHVGTCAGESYAAFAGCTIISSYLFLFISFYFATYKTTVKRTTIKPQDIKSGGKS
ncbi:hypothetical protein MFRU_077g00030 [Monilinia fructicola]|nr:hypothetical protein MFRU_077g00030 [Monilinia fructicola]